MNIVVLTGAGMSAESGISTFRDSGGLWEKYPLEEVATPEAFRRNPELVLDFYNQRRKQIMEVSPNVAHLILADLEKHHNVQIITQNIDDLHERAGSTRVTHLHGEIRKVRSTTDPRLVYDLDGWELKMGDTCEKGSQLRPHIVWFGEMVPMIEVAQQITQQAEMLIIIGTSMAVYPAAGLVHYAPRHIPKFLIDPNETEVGYVDNLSLIRKPATIGIAELALQLQTK
ncbi:MAG: NAD-dependent deacylase [Flavobacteriales bacterium]|nr:NAD-dependent deacylase [Flavobacteriales bacterium]MCB9449247.1 NAD-dependent deacylase [Flavobacteriales bacterium]